ncbi:MAG: hypothetical protein ACON4T_01410 [Synechococcus sp.]
MAGPEALGVAIGSLALGETGLLDGISSFAGLQGVGSAFLMRDQLQNAAEALELEVRHGFHCVHWGWGAHGTREPMVTVTARPGWWSATTSA